VASAKAERPLRREIELDFVRGIAILLVVDYHDNRFGLLEYPLRQIGLPHPGWMGVDIFFVLSGFLVGGLLVKEWKVKGRIDSGGFLARRALKIWPQYYFYLAVMLAVGHRTVRQVWGNLLNIQNYFPGVPHTWSLAVEVHAYFLITLVLAVAAWRKVRMRNVFLFFAGTCVLLEALRLALVWRGVDPFYPTQTRVSGILYGVMLAMVYHYAPEVFRRMQGWWWLWGGILVATLVYSGFDIAGWWDRSVTLDLADLSGIAVLMLLYRHREGRQRSWVYRAVAWVGVYSYGIFLWHVSVDAPIAAVGRHFPGRFELAWRGIAPLVGGVLMGFVTTKLVEFPALRLRDRLFPRRVDSAVGTPAELEPLEADA
jgi:peptidoglycan/LPS O-acetylase OafA/YrhL